MEKNGHDPPLYEPVNVVDLFASKFRRKQNSIEEEFAKKQLILEKKHKQEFEHLEKERAQAFAKLNQTYLKWMQSNPEDEPYQEPKTSWFSYFFSSSTNKNIIQDDYDECEL